MTWKSKKKRIISCTNFHVKKIKIKPQKINKLFLCLELIAHDEEDKGAPSGHWPGAPPLPRLIIVVLPQCASLVELLE